MADLPQEIPLVIKQQTFVGGVQDFLPAHMVRDTSAIKLENCEIHTHGTIRRRGGLRVHIEHATDVSGNPLLLKGFTGIRGVSPLICAVYKTDQNTAKATIDQGPHGSQTYSFPAEFSFDHEGDVFKLLDRLYFGREGQEPLYWESGAATLQQELAVPGFPESTIPPVVTGVFFQGRGWVTGDPAADDLIYFSDALGSDGEEEASRNPLTWDRHFQAFRMETGKVTAIVPFRNTALICFTVRGIEMLEPNCCEVINSHRLTLHRSTGCPFRQTIQLAGEDLYFMDQEGHIRSLSQTELDESRGVTNAPLSITIKNVIDRQNKDWLEVSRSAFSKGMYWIAMPMDGSRVCNEVWGYSIRDQAWVGPYRFGRDTEDEILTAFTVGGMAGHRFVLDEERLYVLVRNHEDTINTDIGLEVDDLTDEEVMIPLQIVTKSYSPQNDVRKTWFHTEQEIRPLFTPQDATISMRVEVNSDEGTFSTVGTLTVTPDANALLPQTLPFTLGVNTRQNIKSALTSITTRSYGLQERVTIRDDTSRFELITLQVTGLIDEKEFSR